MKKIYFVMLFFALNFCSREEAVYPVVIRNECQVLGFLMYVPVHVENMIAVRESVSKKTKTQWFDSYLVEGDSLCLVTHKSGDQLILTSLSYSATITSPLVFKEIKSKILNSVIDIDSENGYDDLNGEPFSFSSGTCTLSIHLLPPEKDLGGKEGLVSIELYDWVIMNEW